MHGEVGGLVTPLPASPQPGVAAPPLSLAPLLPLAPSMDVRWLHYFCSPVERAEKRQELLLQVSAAFQ